MQIREYEDRDLAALCGIHAAQGFNYALPDLRNPLFVTKLILTDEDDTAAADSESQNKTLGAAFLRLTAEAYLLLDPKSGTPRERWQWLLALHAAAERDAWQRGLEDVHAWLPPTIAKTFGRRIQRLGWVRDDSWTPFCKRFSEGK